MNHVANEFHRFGKYLIQQARSNLTRQGHKASGDLYNSLAYDFKQYANSIEFAFSMESYGEFLDKGVKGKDKTDKAPQSPFRFGSGTGRRGGLTEGIDGWVRRKRFQFREPSGRFMSYESTAFLITRSIYRTGLRTTRFYSLPLERGYDRFAEDVVEAYGLDVDDFLKNTKGPV